MPARPGPASTGTRRCRDPDTGRREPRPLEHPYRRAARQRAVPPRLLRLRRLSRRRKPPPTSDRSRSPTPGSTAATAGSQPRWRRPDHPAAPRKHPRSTPGARPSSSEPPDGPAGEIYLYARFRDAVPAALVEEFDRLEPAVLAATQRDARRRSRSGGNAYSSKATSLTVMFTSVTSRPVRLSTRRITFCRTVSVTSWMRLP